MFTFFSGVPYLLLGPHTLGDVISLAGLDERDGDGSNHIELRSCTGKKARRAICARGIHKMWWRRQKI